MTRYWAFVGVLLGVLLGLFLVVEALGIPLLTDPTPWMEGAGPAAALLGLGLLVADVVLPVPSSLVMAMHGALFGVALGAGLSLAGTLGAALVGFAIGRRSERLLRRFVPQAERERANRLLARWGALAILVTRPVPLLAETTAMAAGASRLPWRVVLGAALVGSLPQALLYALAGAIAGSFGSVALLFAVTLLLALSFSLLGRRLQRSLEGRSSPSPRVPLGRSEGR